MGIKLNAAKQLSIVEIETSRCSHFRDFLMFPKENSRSFLWKHEKDGTIHPVLPQLYISYGMKRPAGEIEHYPTRVRDTVTGNDGILRSPLRIKPSSEMTVFCFAFAG